MSHGVVESDWKVFRELREVALERFCERILGEAKALASDDSATSHKRFLELYSLVNDRNQDIASSFDAPRRSAMLAQLAHMCRHDLFEPEELDRFTPDTRDTARSIADQR